MAGVYVSLACVWALLCWAVFKIPRVASLVKVLLIGVSYLATVGATLFFSYDALRQFHFGEALAIFFGGLFVAGLLQIGAIPELIKALNELRKGEGPRAQ